MVIASPVAGGGTVVVCMPLSAEYLANTSAKLGLELGLSVGGGTIAMTRGFPSSAMAIARHEATQLE